MSGIAGIYYLDGRPVERMDIQRMVDSIAHRGPDGFGVWTDGPVGLGHRMLWTTPESLHEKLPFTNKTGDLTITADARIDNRDELIPAINFNGRPRENITDSEIILAAYEKWGEQCPEKLLGDFSFAIWNKRKQTIYCARDHMGIKPFYYYRSNKIFAFASEIKAILTQSEAPRRLNEVMVAYYLVSMFEDKTITFYQDIFRLPPAHTMTVDYGKVRVNKYWSLDPSRELKLGSDEEYAEAFRDIFTEAVRCRLRSAFPIGSMLSGGLDSSSIVCVARHLLSQNGGVRLQTFSAIFDEVTKCDERNYINMVLAQGSIEPHYIHADRLSPLTDLDRVFWHEDEPFFAPNLFIHWGLFSAAKHQGIHILLDGLDGDATVSYGITYLTELIRKGSWVVLSKEINGLSKHFNRSPWKIFRSYCLSPFIPQPIRQVWRMFHWRNRPAWRIDNIVNPGFARRIGLDDRIQTLQGEWARPPRTEREHHYLELTWGLIPFIIEIGDRAAGAFFLEPRYPFLDIRLVEFCLALPPEQKIQNGWTRMVMRRAMAGILPVEIQWRGGKSDLSPNFDRGLMTFEQKRLDEVIFNNSKAIEEYVNISTVRNAYHKFVSKRNSDDVMSVWIVATLCLWFNHTGIKP
jgi:asparagine synthase (glutamine-hydrolysing)